ncbi:MAG: helix-turn-helix transcriptional regulator [Spirochaetales bacterium]|nr:helix-turn-helix transcriptional regulator [Spirochaetales bacterium]
MDKKRLVKSLIDRNKFNSIAAEYSRLYNYCLALISEGEVVFNICSSYNWKNLDISVYDRMIDESVRWGEPNISMDTADIYIWCAPLCFNNETIGGIFSASRSSSAEMNREKNVREASWKLLEIVESHNLCPVSLMQLNRMTSRMNARTAEAIHAAKGIYYQNPRDIYMIEERALINAVKNGSFERAREIINRILVGIYHLGKHDFDVLKALVLEMVVQMYRAAVEEGADPKNLLGVNSTYLADFSRIEEEKELSDWLSDWLETFIKTSIDNTRKNVPASLSVAIEYIKSNLNKPITRDEVARMCNISPAYFSRVVKLRTGYTFTELLNRIRIDYACSLLDSTDKNVAEVGFACGFNDQSYFTKVFKRKKGISPNNYKKRIKH